MSVPVLGDFQVTARVVMAGHNTIAFTDVQVDGQLPDSVRDLFAKALERTIPLENPPTGLSLTRLATGADGLTATLSGSDVAFAPSGQR